MFRQANKRNEKAFCKLIGRYETITLEEIEQAFIKYKVEEIDDSFGWYRSMDAKKELTGLGSRGCCTLCLTSGDTCDKCVYRVVCKAASLRGTPCNISINQATYWDMINTTE